MADNVAITAGSGTTVAADEVVDATLGTVKVQFFKLMDGALDGTTKATVGANGLKVDGSGATQPVSGTFWQATQPVSGTFFQATQPVSLATNTPDVTDRAARLLGVISTGTNSIGTTLGPTLTKGTQGTTGYSTQNLKDAGRSRVTIGFYAVAPAVADTLLSLVKVTAGVAAVGATSIAVASGKTLRITSITFSLRAGAAAVAFGTMTLRQNPTGATVIGSQTELRMDLGNTAATIGAADKFEAVFPDGMEFSGTQTLGVSLAAQAVTNTISITISGFEY